MKLDLSIHMYVFCVFSDLFSDFTDVSNTQPREGLQGVGFYSEGDCKYLGNT